MLEYFHLNSNSILERCNFTNCLRKTTEEENFFVSFMGISTNIFCISFEERRKFDEVNFETLFVYNNNNKL